MSKTLVYLNKKEYTRLNSFFPKEHPLLIKVAGLSFLEYYIQMSLKIGNSNIEVVSQDLDKELIDSFESGNRWGVELSFRNSTSSLEALYNDINDITLIINGLGLITSHIKDKYIEFLRMTNEPLIVKELGFFIIYSKEYIADFDSIRELKKFRVQTVNSLQKYLKVTKDILCCNNNFTLNGYNNDENVYLGQNVCIPKTSKIIPPIVMGNNVILEGLNTIGPNVVIGSNVVIDRGSTVENSVVYDGTFIGKNLEIIDKLVYKNRLTSAYDEDASYYLTDPVFLSEVRSALYKVYFKTAIRSFFVLPYLIISAIPFLILKIFSKIELRKRAIFLDTMGKEGEDKRFILSNSTNNSFVNNLFKRFSIDIYPKVFGIFNGSYRLVGSKPIDVNRDNEKNLTLSLFYKPGLFNINTKTEDVEQHFGKVSLFIEIFTFYKELLSRLFMKK
jgi:hypothetical protein